MIACSIQQSQVQTKKILSVSEIWRGRCQYNMSEWRKWNWKDNQAEMNACMGNRLRLNPETGRHPRLDGAEICKCRCGVQSIWRGQSLDEHHSIWYLHIGWDAHLRFRVFSFSFFFFCVAQLQVHPSVIYTTHKKKKWNELSEEKRFDSPFRNRKWYFKRNWVIVIYEFPLSP